MSVLKVEDLSVAYKSGSTTTRVVHDVSFEVEQGEVLALVGESGSGKSTTAHAIIGLLAANGTVESGRIELNGTDIAGWSDKRLQSVRGARIGLIPQDPATSLNPVRTIGAQLGEVLRIHKRGPKATVQRRVIELLDRVGLNQPELRARQYPHELSGGMRQRVLIANAVALQPELVIADEATSALDVTVQRLILDLLDDLREEIGTSILFVTHDLGVAADRSRRIAVMRNGRIEEQGTTADVLLQPQTEYARRLFLNAPALNPGGFRDRITVSPVAAPGLAADAGPGPDSTAALPGQAETAVEVRDLVQEFRLGGKDIFRAVDGVSFAVRRGTTHSIVGESGSGKTTTARAVVGFSRPTSGVVRVDGQDVASLKGEQLRQFRRHIQLVYQNPFGSLDPLQSIEHIVAEPMRNFGLGSKAERHRQAAGLIDRVALPSSVLARRPRELSGGQRQRVALARALAVRPDVLVLDEAVSALDVTVQAQILDLLDGLQQELGLTYLFISHDLAVVQQISDTVSVMSRGRVVESGTTRDVFERPQQEYTRNLLAAIPGVRT